MKKTEKASAATILAMPVLVGLGSTLLLMAVFALGVLRGGAQTSQIPLFTRGCLAVGHLLCALLAARRAVRSRLVWGFAAGMILFACLVILSLLWLGEPVSVPHVGINFAVCATFSLGGGILGAGMRRKKHRKS